MDFLSTPSNFLVQCFRNSDSKDLGLEDLGMWFRHSAEAQEAQEFRERNPLLFRSERGILYYSSPREESFTIPVRESGLEYCLQKEPMPCREQSLCQTSRVRQAPPPEPVAAPQKNSKRVLAGALLVSPLFRKSNLPQHPFLMFFVLSPCNVLINHRVSGFGFRV